MAEMRADGQAPRTGDGSLRLIAEGLPYIHNVAKIRLLNPSLLPLAHFELVEGRSDGGGGSFSKAGDGEGGLVQCAASLSPGLCVWHY